MKKKDIFIGFIITLLMIVASFEEPIPTETKETQEDIIHWKQEEVTIEEIDTTTLAEPLEELTFYDVPLSEELQLHIFQECEKHNIAPAIVIAMIERESNYKADAIGDNGNSLGLMQIQPKWNQKRMSRLGCTDLLDPYQNVTVGIDLLAELIEEDADLYWVLMAYNAGQSKATEWLNNGIHSDYSIYVVERATELQREYENGKN